MPVNDPESILSYQVKCIYMSEAVPVTFNLCRAAASIQFVFNCIICGCDCVISAQLFDNKTSIHVHAHRPCIHAAVSSNHHSIGFP